MSDQDRTTPSDATNDGDRAEVRDSDPMLNLLRGALDEPPLIAHSLLPRVQDRIRRRTRGRYFKNRYSRSPDPVPLILIMALLLLMIAAALFLVIQPLVNPPEPVKLREAPTDPLAPASPREPAP